MASLAIAQAFNGMAFPEGEPISFTIGGALILFAGHALNIILAAMGVIGTAAGNVDLDERHQQAPTWQPDQSRRVGANIV